MASGLDDSAKTIYYSNINYNATNAPISSYVMNNLQSRYLLNQTNYQVAINKLKISSLQGVKIGNFPYNQWELGLKISDAGGVAHYTTLPVSMPNLVQTTDYYEYVSSINTTTYAIETYRNDVVANTTTLFFSFTPEYDDAPVYANFAFYDTIGGNYWLTDFTNIYVYNAEGDIIAQKPLTNIIYSYFDGAGNILVCESYQGSPDFNQVLVFNLQSSIITAVGAVRTSFAGASLANVQCCASDGTTIIVGWGNNKITLANAITYAPSQDLTLSGANNIQSIIIDTANNAFIVLDNKSNPDIFANTNIASTPINLVNLSTGTTIINTSQNYNSLASSVTSGNYQFVSSGTAGTPPYQSSYASVPLSSLTPATPYTSSFASGTQPVNVCMWQNYSASSTVVAVLGVGTEFNIVGNDVVLVALVNNDWLPVYTFPSTGGAGIYPYQVSVNYLTGDVWVNQGGYLYKSSQPPVIGNFGIIDFTGITFNLITNILVNNVPYTNVTSIAWDSYLPNTCYCLLNKAPTNNGIIYKGYYNAVANSIILGEYAWTDGTPYYNYLCIQPRTSYATGTAAFNIFKYQLSNGSLVSFVASPNIVYSNLAKSFQLGSLLVGNLTGRTVDTYNINTLASTGSLSIALNNFTNISNYTSSTLIPPSTAALAVYDMATYITALNNCFIDLYAILKAEIQNIQVATAPYYTLDYNTKLLTLNYDPKYATTGNGIYINSAALVYALFPTVAGDVDTLSKYVLSTAGDITQSKNTFYLLNRVDKLIIVTNMSLLTDYTGLDKQLTTFTDLDFDTTQTGFFNMDSDFIYNAILLRQYDMMSNQTLRSISYQLYIQYLDGEEIEYKVPVGQNVSIKFEFSRVF